MGKTERDTGGVSEGREIAILGGVALHCVSSPFLDGLREWIRITSVTCTDGFVWPFFPLGLLSPVISFSGAVAPGQGCFFF